MVTRQEKNNWMWDNYRRLFLDYHYPAWDKSILRNVDVKSMMRTFRKSHVQVLVCYAKSCVGYSYYSTSVGVKHPGIGERDLLGEIIEAAHESEMKVLVYCGALLDRLAGDKHPEWIQKNIEGEKISLMGSYWLLCPNSPYRETVMNVVREVVKEYKPDGVWLDMIMFSAGVLPPNPRAGCFCTNCKRDYKDITGRDLCSKDLSLFKSKFYQQWRSQSLERFLSDCQKTVKDIDKNVLFVHNFTQSLFRNFSHTAAELDDIISMEAHPETPSWGVGGFRGQGAGLLNFTITARYLSSFLKPPEVLIHRFGNEWGWGLKSEEELESEILTIISHNVPCGVIDQPYNNGELEPYFYKILGKIYKKVQALEPWLKDRRPLVDFAIFYSEDSANFYDNGTTHREAFLGICKLMLENQCLFEIVTPYSLDKLRAKTLILPEVGRLDEKSFLKIIRFLKRGGNVVFSNESSLYDEGGVRRAFSLFDFFGIVDKGETETCTSFIIPKDNVISKGIGAPLIFFKKAKLVEASGARETYLPIELPLADYTWEKMYGNFPTSPPVKKTNFDSVFIFENGVYFSEPVFSTYVKTGDPRISTIVINTLNRFKVTNLNIEAPSYIEVAAFEKDDGSIILHFINNAQPPGLSGRYQPRYRQGTITVKVSYGEKLQKVFKVPTGEQIPLIKENTFLVKVTLHQAVCLKPQRN